jgi:hypothetical protein
MRKRITSLVHKADCAKFDENWRCYSVLLIRCQGLQRDSCVTCKPVLCVNTCEGLQGDQNYIQ